MDTQGPEMPAPAEDCAAAAEELLRIRDQVATVFVGDADRIGQLIQAVVGGGHVLVESLPGMGKTLLVKALGKVLGLANRRIQFTPDLMPADITGSHVFNTAERRFVFMPGPLFTQLLLADELNRSPAKTHAALLEAMQERQVTLDGTTYLLQAPFAVIATENPIESEGTYQLPEAAVDRFLIKLLLEYPSPEQEMDILRLHMAGRSPEDTLAGLCPCTDAAGLLRLQGLARRIHVEDTVLAYIAAIVRATRGHPFIHLGASPRAGVALLAMARGAALLAGRAFVVPDDVAGAAPAVLRHRLMLSPEAEIEGRSADTIIADILPTIPVPGR